jgi:hypothetical protein
VGPHPSDLFTVCTYLDNTPPTNRFALLEPPHASRLDLSLHAENGKEVPTTRAGDALCKSVPSRLRSRGNILCLVSGLPSRFDAPFDLRDCFKVSDSGAYILTVTARLSALKAYPDVVALDLPATQVRVMLTENDLEHSQ